MSIFNLKKKSKDYGYKNVNNLLKDKNKETNLTVIEPAGNINQILTTKNLDNIEINEKQLEAKRQGKDSFMITDKALDNSDKLYNDKRLDETGDIMPINLLSESFDQKHLEAYKKAEEKKKDTMFWDKYVGVQLEEDKTVVGKNIEKNQIENNPDRFKSLNNKDIKDILERILNVKSPSPLPLPLNPDDFSSAEEFFEAANKEFFLEENKHTIGFNEGLKEMRLVFEDEIKKIKKDL